MTARAPDACLGPPPRTAPGPRPSGRPVVAVDLDQTLIYSARALDRDQPAGPLGPLVCVEHLDGRPASFMTERAAWLVATLAKQAMLVPVTTRTRKQYDRVRLPMRTPAYAVTANGGQLLVDGSPDAEWAGWVAHGLAAGTPLAAVREHLRALLPSSVLVRGVGDGVRVADGLFCYAVLHRAALPAGLVEELTGWAAARGWAVSLQGRKLYCVPSCLRKSVAVAEVVRRTVACALYAAGDSWLDAELLAVADAAIRPAHGELAERGWTHPTVTVGTGRGVAAGEQLCAWLLDRVRAIAVPK